MTREEARRSMIYYVNRTYKACAENDLNLHLYHQLLEINSMPVIESCRGEDKNGFQNFLRNFLLEVASYERRMPRSQCKDLIREGGWNETDLSPNFESSNSTELTFCLSISYYKYFGYFRFFLVCFDSQISWTPGQPGWSTTPRRANCRLRRRRVFQWERTTIQGTTTEFDKFEQTLCSNI